MKSKIITKAFVGKDKAPFPFRIGADPEFNFQLHSRWANARGLIEQIYKRTDFKRTNMGFNIARAGEIGWDGHNATAEIRPNPTHRPQTLTKNIKQILADIGQRTQIFDMSTTSQHAPIGGHIHFEVEPEEEKKIDIIHKQMVTYYMPLLLGDNPVNLSIRRQTGYGGLGDFRTQSIGNARTYEFRVPSAEWLTTENVACATIAYLAVVFNEITRNPKNFQKVTKQIIQNTTDFELFAKLSESSFHELAEHLCQGFVRALKKFEYYDAYQDEIKYITHYRQVRREKERACYNVLYGWNIIENKQPTKRELLNEKTLVERVKAKAINLDNLISAISIPCNQGDTNIPLFAEAMKQRMLALNWRLTNEYFLFGLKKGVEGFIAVDAQQENIYTGQDLIKTDADKTAISEVLTRMKNHLAQKFTPANLKKVIIIGIPYELRLAKNTKNLIGLICDIESKRLKSQSFKQMKNLKLGTMDDKGELHYLLTKVEENDPAQQFDN